MINQNGKCFLIGSAKKKLIKALKKSVQQDKLELKKNQILWEYLIQLKIKTIRSKGGI